MCEFSSWNSLMGCVCRIKCKMVQYGFQLHSQLFIIAVEQPYEIIKIPESFVQRLVNGPHSTYEPNDSISQIDCSWYSRATETNKTWMRFSMWRHSPCLLTYMRLHLMAFRLYNFLFSVHMICHLDVFNTYVCLTIRIVLVIFSFIWTLCMCLSQAIKLKNTHVFNYLYVASFCNT